MDRSYKPVHTFTFIRTLFVFVVCFLIQIGLFYNMFIGKDVGISVFSSIMIGVPFLYSGIILAVMVIKRRKYLN